MAARASGLVGAWSQRSGGSKCPGQAPTKTSFQDTVALEQPRASLWSPLPDPTPTIAHRGSPDLSCLLYHTLVSSVLASEETAPWAAQSVWTGSSQSWTCCRRLTFMWLCPEEPSRDRKGGEREKAPSLHSQLPDYQYNCSATRAQVGAGVPRESAHEPPVIASSLPAFCLVGDLGHVLWSPWASVSG